MILVKFGAVLAIPFLFSFASEAICSPAQREPNASLALEGGPAGAYYARNPDEQAAVTRRKITGVVLDPSGAAIAGAEVILVTDKGALVGRTTTDNEGSFRFEEIAPGAYKLEVRATGFRETQVEAKLSSRGAGRLRVVMPIAAKTEVVTVGESDTSLQVSTEASENQNANLVDRSTLDRVPIFDQDYISTLSRFLDDSAIGTSGVSLIVNGIEANGPGVPPSAIQEVRINQNPYSARFARPGRARLEIITKGGTPDYHGSVNFLFRDAIFDARNAFAAGKPPEQRQFYEGSLTGPVGRGKKTSFLLGLEWDKDDNQAAVVATGANNTAIHENVPQPMRHFFGSGRIFHDFNEKD
ncbi:MAG: carboxypeptidase-like regulatory domain-containing protein, partial [Candidatus Acidiferrum sp.]